MSPWHIVQVVALITADVLLFLGLVRMVAKDLLAVAYMNAEIEECSVCGCDTVSWVDARVGPTCVSCWTSQRSA